MVAVAEVDVLLVEVVNVPIVAYLNMSAALTVLMVVALGGPMAGGVALVVMPIVGVVQMAFVDVIDVSDMLERLVPAVRPVDVRVSFMDRMRGGVRCHPSSLFPVFPQVGACLPAQAAAQPDQPGGGSVAASAAQFGTPSPLARS